jgi:hypothetical protein
MRRLVTMLAVAVATATGTLYWLHDGDLEEAITPVIEDIDPQGMIDAARQLAEKR